MMIVRWPPPPEEGETIWESEMSKCAICSRKLEPRRGERPHDFRRRSTCGEDCRVALIHANKLRDATDWTVMRAPWPEGMHNKYFEDDPKAR